VGVNREGAGSKGLLRRAKIIYKQHDTRRTGECWNEPSKAT